MEIKNTQKDYENVASINMLVYGVGGVGKSTFASTFPKPLMFDFENGAKYFNQRGINIDVIKMDKWFSLEEKKKLLEIVKDYETLIFDPIGEAMDKLIHSSEINGTKYRQSDGSLTMNGWGKVKDEMRTMLKWARDTGKHIVIIAHDDNEPVAGSEGMVKKVPLIATKLGAELVNMVDIVGYLDIINLKEGEEKRVLRINSADSGYIAKDRTGTLEKFVKPDFEYIYNQILSKQIKKTVDSVCEEVLEEMGETGGEFREEKLQATIKEKKVATQNPFKKNVRN